MATDRRQSFIVAEDRIRPVLLTLMAIGFLALVGAGMAAAWVIGNGQRHNVLVAHTYEVELAIADVRRLIEEGEAGRRGYMLAPGATRFLNVYRKAAVRVPRLDRLQRLTVDNPLQQRNLAEARRLVDTITAARADAIASVERGDVVDAIARFRDQADTLTLDAVRALFDKMRTEERRLLGLRDAEQASSIRTFYTILSLAGLMLLGVAVVSLLTVIRSTRSLAASRDALHAANESLEGQVAERTAGLSRANEEIQRFAYIVSHDLRSPLVNVMGFTAELESAATEIQALVDRAEAAAPEIVTEEARLAAREDLPEAIGFIRSSTERMDRLINAILALSRQGRRVLAAEPLDVDAIVAGIRDTLAHRLESEGSEIVIEPTLPEITSDRIAIEQILANLIENAVKYAAAGRAGRIVVRGGGEGRRRWVEVEGNGRGIDPRDHERVFDLFRRSGAQDQPGEGIGLAHARALAYRLGGTIDLRSTLGEGATFRLMLPANLPENKALSE